MSRARPWRRRSASWVSRAEEIVRLVGHRSTTVTEAVYRKQLRPVLTEGAEAMDRIFASEDVPPRPDTDSNPGSDPNLDP